MEGKDALVDYVIVNNIPNCYRSCDLRNFFSQFLETSGFACFHFRHRPEVQKISETKDKDTTPSFSNSNVNETSKSRRVTTCCVVKVYANRVNELIRMYHKKHWIDRKGGMMASKCFIKRIVLRNKENEKNSSSGAADNIEETVSDNETLFTQKDLPSLIEMNPPVLMPNGNVGTPTKYFLEQIQACRLPPSLISRLKLEFPHSRARRLYSCVKYDYGGCKARCENYEQPLVRTSKGHVLSKNYVDDSISKDDSDELKEGNEVEVDDEEESEEEEWDRHESLHNDVTQQERLKERLFEEEIELQWEKGGSGLVFYTDAQLWDEKEGDFDAKTADDWDIDMSGYYEPGAGDKDARDALKMRLEERLRQGLHTEMTNETDFAGFEKFSKGFGRRLLEAQGWKEGQGIGKTVIGMAEPILENGQHPRNKKGFGYRGEKLNRCVLPKRRKRRRHCRYDDTDTSEVRISTVYDDPLANDPPEPLLRSSFLTRLKYRQEFIKGSSKENM